MAPRKRSYKWGSDKWLAVAFHNARVDAHRDRKARGERTKRLEAVKTKLRGEGIDVSWADDALGIMESNGYGLNQFSTRVLPELRHLMHDAAIEEQRKAAEEERRKASIAEAKRQKALKAEQRRVEKQAQQERQATDAEMRRRDAALAREQKVIGDNRRKEADDALKLAIAENRQLPVSGSSVDKAITERACASTFHDVSLEADEIKAMIENPMFSPKDVIGVVNRSIYFDFSGRGVFTTLGILLGDIVLGVITVSAVMMVAAPTKSTLAALIAAFVLVIGLPVFVVWHYIRLRRRRIRLVLPRVSGSFQRKLLANADGKRMTLRHIGRKDIPDELSGKIEAINKGFMEASKRPWS